MGSNSELQKDVDETINRLQRAKDLIKIAALTLIIIVWTTVYFLHQQNTKLQEKAAISSKQATVSPIPTITLVTTPDSNIGYSGYNADGKRFRLDLPNECQKDDRGINENQQDRFEITCIKENYKIVINPQAAGRGLGDYKPTEVKNGNLLINGYNWEYTIWIDADRSAFSTYSLIDRAKYYYLIEVHYYPYSESAKLYFDQILSTFKFTD